MKIKKISSLVLLGLLLGVAACSGSENPTTAPTTAPTEAPTTTAPLVDTAYFYDGDNLYTSVELQNGLVSKPTDPVKDGYSFEGWFTEADLNEFSEFDFAEEVNGNINLYAKFNKCYKISFVTNQSSVTVDSINASTIGSLPTPKCTGYSFLGWFTDSLCYNQLNRGTELTSDITLYARWEEAPELGYELAEINLDISNALTPGIDGDNDILSNGFKIIKSTAVEERSASWTDGTSTLSFSKVIRIGDNNTGIEFTIQGDAVVEIYAQNGSTGSANKDVMIKNLTGGISKTVRISGSEAVGNYPAGNPVCKVVQNLSAGTYHINRNTGTLFIYYVRVTSTLERAAETGFEISNTGNVEIFEGQKYKPTNLIVSNCYANGRTSELASDNANLSIDYSAVKKTAGVYPVTVKYKNYEAQTFNVYVYSVDEINLYFNRTFKSSQNSYVNNGRYITGLTKEIYAINQEFDPSYLTVKIITSHPEDNTQKEFKLTGGYTIDSSQFDSTKAGKYEINIGLSFKEGITNSFMVEVVDTPISMVNGVALVCVDKSYNGQNAAVVDGYNMFSSIQNALEYIENCNLDANVEKLLKINAGYYNEKLEIVTPNLTIIGAGSCIATHEEDDNYDAAAYNAATIIEYDALYGIADVTGFVHTTDSTPTISVRDTAINCTMKNLTISNYWNCQEIFDKDLGEKYAEHRALALLVQSDKFILDNCSLLGYQDTLELFTGRQYISNTFISGITDFIFGTNNTTYFYQCEIRSIGGKNGYITAFKGLNTNLGTDDIKYGAIFDACDFTCDKDVAAEGTAIGRTWGLAAAVMVMNSNLGNHISKSATVSPRYVSMNCSVTEATVQFTEYNNTGAGAITEAIDGCKILTDAEAAKYNNFSVIFGSTNGNVTYPDSWIPQLS